ncbi:ER membrane protein complex subunit 1 [Agrilus planipennis]|uniref:ER membrane protein complex subunit 1 n=1 Tax=Agrilus planipennis TaxID=224129 RepID=A0A1W4WSM5_AGRPL|nr:ER membrane protein complex subunit 1 [Agrilus planipennis]
MDYFKSILLEFLIFLLFFNKTFALYEDQVDKFDWKQSYIGKIEFANLDSLKKIIVATEENVIASLNLKNGQIVWRQVLENPLEHRIKLLHVQKEAVSVSGDGHNWFVRGWDLSSGTLLREWTIHLDKNMTSYFTVSENKLLHIAAVPHSHIELSKYHLLSGQNSGKSIKINGPWIKDLTQCTISGLFFACLDENKVKYINLLQEQKMYAYDLSDVGKESESMSILPFKSTESSVILVKNDNAKVLRLNPDGSFYLLPYEVSPSVVSATNGEQNILLHISQMVENNGKYQITNLDTLTGEEIVFTIETNKEFWQPNILCAICKGTACRVLVQTLDNSLSVIQLPSGKIVWTREEALSQIVATEFVELPVSPLDASIEHEFDIGSGGVIDMFKKRITSQFNQLKLLMSGSQTTTNTTLWRDDFGLHKLIVLVTKVGKLFVLDTLTGNIVWSKYLPNTSPFDGLNNQIAALFVQRTARHHPLSPQCIVLMKSSISGNGIVYIFDPITGNVVNVKYLSSPIQQAMLMPQETENFLKPLIIFTTEGLVELVPESAIMDLYSYRHVLFMFNINKDRKSISGYSFRHSTEKEAKATLKWNVDFGPSEVVSYGIRPASEIVHSQGRVLGDRSVLYKYVNPNLIALSTLTDDPLHKNVHTFYLIDGVSGLVIYSACHKRTREPIHIIHSENWLVYTYFNERFRRTEVVALELYEGSFQSNSTHFSSHAISQLPHVESQAYILPAVASAATVTLTERGITSKHLLFALTNGAVTQVPWMIMEPRGAFGPSGPEEGFIPYVPELPLPPEANINYNQSLLRVRGISVSPARLESTCLVLVHGLDLFYTRVAPSKTFDLLKEDFDHGLIVMVLVGLTIASFVTKYLASQKAVRQMWK